MCRVLGAARSGYNAWRKRGVAPRQLRREELLEKIRQMHKDSPGTYGSPRILPELRNQGVIVNHKTVDELMKRNGIRAKQKRK